MEYRNARYLANGDIDCEVNHPTHGWLPYTASIDAPDPENRRLFMDVVKGDDVAEYTPPPPPTYEELLAAWRNTAICEMLALQDYLIDVGLFAQAEEVSKTVDDKWRIRWEARGGVIVHRGAEVLDGFAAMIGLAPDDLDNMPIWMPSKPKPEVTEEKDDAPTA